MTGFGVTVARSVYIFFLLASSLLVCLLIFSS